MVFRSRRWAPGMVCAGELDHLGRGIRPGGWPLAWLALVAVAALWPCSDQFGADVGVAESDDPCCRSRLGATHVRALEAVTSIGQKLLFGAMAVLLAPVVEEVVFRGILYPTIKA